MESPIKTEFKKNDIIYIREHQIYQNLIENNKKILAKIDNVQTFNNYILNLKYRLLLYKSDLPISGTFNDLITNIRPEINKLIININNNQIDFINQGNNSKQINNIDMIDGYGINYLLKYVTKYLNRTSLNIKSKIESKLEEVN